MNSSFIESNIAPSMQIYCKIENIQKIFSIKVYKSLIMINQIDLFLKLKCVSKKKNFSFNPIVEYFRFV